MRPKIQKVRRQAATRRMRASTVAINEDVLRLQIAMNYTLKNEFVKLYAKRNF